MPGRLWTEAEEHLLAAHLTCCRVPTIARRLGRTEKSVQQYMWRHRLAPTNQHLVTSGVAAELTGLSPQRLTALARAGCIRARRVPGGRWWMFDPEDLPAPVTIPGMDRAIITPHAVRRFQERIWSGATAVQATAVIRMAIASEGRRIRVKARDDGSAAWTLRSCGIEAYGRTFDLRLTLAAGDRPGAPPVVVTVLQGTRGYSRGRNHYSTLRARAVPPIPRARREFNW